MDAVRIKAQTDTTLTLEGWAVVYGGADLTGETFTKATDFWFTHLGLQKPLLYEHGFDAAMKANVVGSASLEPRDEGVWFEAQLDRSARYAAQIERLAGAGVLGASTGAVAHLVAYEDDDTASQRRIKAWPVAELSLTVTPAEPRTLGVHELRSLAALQPDLERLLPQEASAEASVQAKGTGERAAIVVLDPPSKEHTDMAEPITREDYDGLSAKVAGMEGSLVRMDQQLITINEALTKALKYAEDTPAIRGAGYITVDGGTADKHVKSLGDFLMAIKRHDETRLLKVYGSVKDVLEQGGTTGGYIVPEDHRTTLVQVANMVSPLSGLVQQIPVSTDRGTWPALNQYAAPTAGVGNTAFAAGVTAAVTAEGVTLTETQPTFKEITWNINKIGGYTEVSNEVAADANSIEALLRMLFGVAIGSKREYCILRGTGVAMPLGVLNASCTVAVSTNADNTFAWVDAMNMLSRFKPVTGAIRWVMHQGVLPDLAASGFVTGNVPRKIEDMGYGSPILSEHMPQDDYDDVILGDWGTYLLFVRQGLTIDYSEHAAFTADKGTWRFKERLDGQPWLQGAITLADPQGSYTVSTFVYHDD